MVALARFQTNYSTIICGKNGSLNESLNLEPVRLVSIHINALPTSQYLRQKKTGERTPSQG